MSDDLMRSTLDFVRSMYDGERGDYDMWPHLFGFSGDGGVIAATIDPGYMDFERKRVLAQLVIPSLIRKHKITSEIVMASPAWSATTEGPRDTLPRDLADAPNRREIVMLWRFTAEGEVQGWTIPVERRGDLPPRLGDLEVMPPQTVEKTFGTYAIAAMRANRVVAGSPFVK